MSRFEDLRGVLEEQIAREQAALDFVARLERFVTALEDVGFGVLVDVRHLSGAEMQVGLQVICPAGLVGASSVALVEPLARDEAAQQAAYLEELRRSGPAGVDLEQTVAPVAEPEPEPEPAPETKPGFDPETKAPLGGITADGDPQEDAQIIEMRVQGKSLDYIAKILRRSKTHVHARVAGPLADAIAERSPVPRNNLPWSDDEDADLVARVVAGEPVADIAQHLGRTKAALVYRCKTALSARISAGKARRTKPSLPVSASPRVREAPAPEAPAPQASVAPQPVADPLPEVTPASDARPPDARPTDARPLRSPIAGMHGDDVSVQQLRAHFEWLYGGAPDPDVVGVDLDLVEGLCRGDGAGAVAEEFDWSRDQVLDRWCALRGGVPVTLQLQTRLLGLLREMAQGQEA